MGTRFDTLIVSVASLVRDTDHTTWPEPEKKEAINLAIQDSFPAWYLLEEADLATTASNTLRYTLSQTDIPSEGLIGVEVEQGTGEPYTPLLGWRLVNDAGTLYFDLDREPALAGKTIRGTYRKPHPTLDADDDETELPSQWVVYEAIKNLALMRIADAPNVNVDGYMAMAEAYSRMAERVRRSQGQLPPSTRMRMWRA